VLIKKHNIKCDDAHVICVFEYLKMLCQLLILYSVEWAKTILLWTVKCVGCGSVWSYYPSIYLEELRKIMINIKLGLTVPCWVWNQIPSEYEEGIVLDTAQRLEVPFLGDMCKAVQHCLQGCWPCLVLWWRPIVPWHLPPATLVDTLCTAQ